MRIHFLMMPSSGMSSSIEISPFWFAMFVASGIAAAIYVPRLVKYINRKKREANTADEVLEQAFLVHPFVIKTAEDILYNIERRLTCVINDIDSEKVEMQFFVWVNESGVSVSGGYKNSYSFAAEDLQKLRDKEEQKALASALAMRIGRQLTEYRQYGMELSMSEEIEKRDNNYYCRFNCRLISSIYTNQGEGKKSWFD